MRLAALTLLTVLAAAAPAPAAQKTETASAGTIRAELSYVTHKAKPPTDLVLRVFDGDAAIVDQAIPDKQYLTPAFFYVDKPSVAVRDFDADGTPEALFDLYSGGAHCCQLSYLYDGADLHKRNWLDPGYVLADLDGDGRDEFRTGDPRFVSRFGAYASSFPPFQVRRYEDGRYVDITREAFVRPALFKHTGRARRAYRRAHRMVQEDPVYRQVVRSTLAAYTADECLLGSCQPGYELARVAIRRGEVEASFSQRLHRLMRRLNYQR